jgi:hypothetical protein
VGIAPERQGCFVKPFITFLISATVILVISNIYTYNIGVTDGRKFGYLRGQADTLQIDKTIQAALDDTRVYSVRDIDSSDWWNSVYADDYTQGNIPIIIGAMGDTPGVALFVNGVQVQKCLVFGKRKQIAFTGFLNDNGTVTPTNEWVRYMCK